MKNKFTCKELDSLNKKCRAKQENSRAVVVCFIIKG
jgi:hypothetical protein